jgi:hypothetical protein
MPPATTATDVGAAQGVAMDGKGQEVAGGDRSRAVREQEAEVALPVEVDAESLPAHWHQGLDPEGRRYYWNRCLYI